MRGAICYYSASGNTKLACTYAGGRLGAACDLIDVTNGAEVDLAAYDFVGLAAPAKTPSTG